MVQKIPMSRIRERYTRLPIDKKWFYVGIALLLGSFFINIIAVIFLAAVCIANALVLSIDRYVQAPLDIELSTFSAVLMTTAFSLEWGLVAAVLTKMAGMVYNKRIRADHFFMIGGYLLAAVLANTLPFTSITMLGMIITLIVNLYVVFVSKFITRLSLYEIIMYGASNIIFNVVLFIGFAPIILWFMTIL